MAELDTEYNVEEEDAGYSFLDADDEPCTNFRLDTSRSFGTCKCGHPKSAHGNKGENKAAEMLSRLKKNNNEKRSVDSDVGLVEPGDAPCNKFRVDTTASEFGMCKCGFKRLEHVAQQDNQARMALQKLKQSNVDKFKEITKGDSPCGNYRVDTTADEFGVCLCGFKKDDHTRKDENAAAKMLKNLKEKNEKKHEREDLEALGVDMNEYEKEEKAVAELEKQESAAAEAETPSKGKKDKKTKKGGNKVCVVS